MRSAPSTFQWSIAKILSRMGRAHSNASYPNATPQDRYTRTTFRRLEPARSKPIAQVRTRLGLSGFAEDHQTLWPVSMAWSFITNVCAIRYPSLLPIGFFHGSG
jgi:hypothetical protein